MFVWLAPAIASLMSARKPNDWNISMSLWPQNAENLKKNVLLQTLKYPWEKTEESLKDFFRPYRSFPISRSSVFVLRIKQSYQCWFDWIYQQLRKIEWKNDFFDCRKSIDLWKCQFWIRVNSIRLALRSSNVEGMDQQRALSEYPFWWMATNIRKG